MGFCCSCDAYVNTKRQPETLKLPEISPVAFSSSAGRFPQSLTPLKAKKRESLNAWNQEDFIDTKFDSSEVLSKIVKACTNRLLGYREKNLEILKTRGNFTADDTPDEKRDRSARSANLLLPKLYYILPPLEPAVGFTKGADMLVQNSVQDPWKPRTYDSCLSTQNKTSTSCNKRIQYISRREANSKDIRADGWESDFNSIVNTDEGKWSSGSGEQFAENKSGPKESQKKYFKLSPNIQHPYEPNKKSFDKINVLHINQTTETTTKAETTTSRSPKVQSNKTSQPLNGDADIEPADQVYFQSFLEEISKPGDSFSSHKIRKRQITASGTQTRGGQSCIDRNVPSDADPETYHESAHCLRFSDLWYNVYKIKTPFVIHSVKMRMYQKESFEAGASRWVDITTGLKADVGTFTRHLSDPKIVITYTPLNDIVKNDFTLNPITTTLLVPRPLSDKLKNLYPQAKGGPGEYLIVQADDISYDGEDCDKIGVGYAAFSKQPNRCGHPKGTCLKNQPIDYWNYDIEMKKHGKKGKYFLENYADVSDGPLRYDNDRGEYLALGFDGAYSSIVELELNADHNVLVRKSVFVQITEIYTDSSCEHHTRVTIGVTNRGLTSGAFQPRLKNCPSIVPRVWTDPEGPVVYIAPQHRHDFILSLYGIMPITRFYCSVEILNEKKELVATRRVRFQKYDRCICMWHCLCACTGSLEGWRCRPMSLEHYHAAGFLGAIPIDTYSFDIIRRKLNNKYAALSRIIAIVLLIHIVLLTFGIIKGILGLIPKLPYFGPWGMWLVFPHKAKLLTSYYEEDIRYEQTILYDGGDYPIHPFTGSRNLYVVESRFSQFLLNCIFFFIFPGVVFLKIINSLFLCCTNIFFYVRTRGDKKKVSFQDDSLPSQPKSDDPRQTCSSTYKNNYARSTDNYEDESSDVSFIIHHLKTSKSHPGPNELQESSSKGTTLNESRITSFEHTYPTFVFSDISYEIPESIKKRIEELKTSFIVYRIFTHPIPGLKVTKSKKIYSVRGYFQQDAGTLSFTVPSPFQQNWTLEDEPINPPITLNPKDVVLYYENFNSLPFFNELSEVPQGVVINKWYFSDDWIRKSIFGYKNDSVARSKKVLRRHKLERSNLSYTSSELIRRNRSSRKMPGEGQTKGKTLSPKRYNYQYRAGDLANTPNEMENPRDLETKETPRKTSSVVDSIATASREVSSRLEDFSSPTMDETAYFNDTYLRSWNPHRINKVGDRFLGGTSPYR